MRPLLILRPQPGNDATAARARTLGLAVVQYPVFEVAPVTWTAPDPRRFDALLLTSANAIRHGGPQLTSLHSLGVFAVGEATAEAARAAGFRVAVVGTDGVDALLANIPLSTRLLHLAGADRHHANSPHVIDPLTVYESKAIPDLDLPTSPAVAMVHSPRAGACLAMSSTMSPTVRRHITIAAISAPAATASGEGWRAVAIAPLPDDAALLALAAGLCQD